MVYPSQYSWLHLFLNNKLFCDFDKVEVREIGLLSFPICSIYVVNFGKRTDVIHFQISGIGPVINDVFKTKQTSYIQVKQQIHAKPSLEYHLGHLL